MISGGAGSGRHTLLGNIEMTLREVNGLNEDDVYLCTDGDIDRDILFRARAVLCPDLGNLARRVYAGGKDAEVCSFLEEAAAMQNGSFIVGIYDPAKDADVMLSPLFRIFAQNGQGIHLGGNVASQRMLDFSDLGYSEGLRPLKAGYGYMKVLGHGNTLKIKVPSGKEREEQDDYD